MTTAEPRVFRATTESWLGQLLLPLAFFALLTVTAIRIAGLDPWMGGVGLGLLVLIAGLEYMLPMTRNWLQINSRSFEGSLNGNYFEIYWSEVLAAWIYERRRRSYLCLGSRDGTLVIPLRFFDACAVWDNVRALVPSAALEESAMTSLPDYQEWEKARDEAMDTTETSPVSDHWILQVLGWAGLTFFLFGMVEAFGDGQVAQTVIFLLLACVSVIVLLTWGITEISADTIRRYTMFGNSIIAWEDIRWIEIDPLNSVIVIGCDARQFVVPGPGIWTGPGKKTALIILLAQVERRKIPMRRTLMALFRTTRRVRLRK